VSAQETIAPSDRGRRPDIEQELTENYHVQWKYHPGVETKKFDLDKSLHNQARFDPVDRPTVEQYKEAVLRGSAFPAVLAWRPTPRGRLVIIDGNHRLVAHDEAGVPIDMYEIDRDTNPQTVALLTFAMNTTHGRPTTEDERVTQAIYLIDNGASIDHASAAVNVSPRIVKRAISRGKADQRADEVGLKRNEWDGLAQTVKNRLKDISTDEGFFAAAELAFAAKLDANEVFDLVALLNQSGKSGLKQTKIVKQQRADMLDRIQAAAGGVLGTADRKRRTPRQQVSMALGQVMALPEDDKVIIQAYSGPERQEAAENIRAVSVRLGRLADALTPPKRKR
jgi:hypothetical protein